MKKLIETYTFDASAKTVALTGYTVSLASLLLITNVTDNIIIYNFADATKGGTVSGDTITLTYDTTSMADADKLQIYYDDSAATQAVSGTVAVTGVATAANQTTIIGHVDGIEALLTTIDADTSNLSVVGGGTEATAIRVTIANNSTGVLSIDDNGSTVSIDDGGGVITVDGTVAVTNSDITSIKTAVEILDNAISGSEMQVDLASAIPAGTNAIGKLLPPDVDVTAHTNYKKFYYTNAGAVTDGIVWSPAAGKRWHILWMVINVSADATVTFEDDKAAGDEVVMKAEIAGKSGFPVTCPEKYPLASGEDAADLLITTTAGNVYIFGVGYEV